MDRPLLADAAVVFAGERILDIGGAKEMRARYPHAPELDLGDSIILPGLVNAHTHLELSDCTADVRPTGTFADWILSVRGRTQRTPEELTKAVAAATRRGIDQCLHFGVTSVGDISQQCAITRPLLRESPLRAISFGEVLGLSALRWRFDALLPQAIDASDSSPRVRIGLTPHAPYTVDLPGYRTCLQLARDKGLPLATHLAETPDERAFLRDHAGPFQELWQRLGRWQEPVDTYRGGPIDFAHAIGLLDRPTLLAHVNYCDDRELDLLARGRASVVYCPRTHAYFGHPPHRWREMIARGINVALGTDSCASSPDLNLVDELRLLHQIASDVPADQLWKLATLHGAAALEWSHEIGTLTPGKSADCVIFPANGPDPLAHVLETNDRPTMVWSHGTCVVGRGD